MIHWALKSSTPNIKISEHNQNLYSKECFLSSPNNKTELISLLPNSFKADSQDAFVCKGDADSTIASTALELAKENQVVVVADGTGIAVMLLHHWKEYLKNIFFMNGNKCWGIQDAQWRFRDIKEYLLFIHASSGCDSTSAIFGKGKPIFMKLLKKSWKLQNVSDIMNDYWVTENDVDEAAVVAFIEIYGGRMESNLTKVRYSSWLFSLRSCWRQINTWLSKGWERLQYLYSFFAIQSKSLQKILNNLSWCPRVIQTAIVYR